MTTLIIPLVGSHWHPPAKALLEHLPNGTSLRLRRDLENPYDEYAIEVHVEGASVPESQHAELAIKLGGYGRNLEETIAPGAWWKLGHLAASDGKPLAKMQLVRTDLRGNRDLLAATAGRDLGDVPARLAFDGAGLQLVEVETEPQAEGEAG